MTEQELKDAYAQLNAKGLTDEQIFQSLCTLYVNGTINTKEEFMVFLKVLGFNLDPALADLSKEEFTKKLGR